MVFKLDTLASQPPPSCENRRYVLMTAAYNEEAHIERTILSVLSQTQAPRKWVIASDGSVDRTDDIVRAYAHDYDFMHLVRIDRPAGRSFRAKVVALGQARKLLDDIGFDFIGNLDADVSVAPSYYEELIARFTMDPRLGIAGGFVYERIGADYQSRKINRRYSVAHAAQLVRRECYEAIGGYAILDYGGEDWHAQISARMKGWKAEAFPELHIFHHRHTGEADNLLRYQFRTGRQDHCFGSDPLFEAFKCLLLLTDRPVVLAGTARFAGFLWSWLSGEARQVSDDFAAFLRKEQRVRLKKSIGRFVHTQNWRETT